MRDDDFQTASPVQEWELRMDPRAYDTPAKAAEVVQRLVGKLREQAGRGERLEAEAGRLREELSAAQAELAAQRDGWNSARRELGLVTRHFEARVDEEVERRLKALSSPFQERESALRQDNGALRAKTVELAATVETLQSDLRALRRDFDFRLEERKALLEETFRKKEAPLKSLEAEYLAKAAQIEHERTLWERSRRSRLAGVEEECRKLTEAARTEHETLKAEIGRQKGLLEVATNAWSAGVSEMHDQMEAKDARLREEHAKRLEGVERAKKRFEEEAVWLQQRLSERQKMWDEKLRIKEDHARLLEGKVKGLEGDLAVREAQFRDTLKQMAEALEKARRDAAEAAAGAAKQRAGQPGLPGMQPEASATKEAAYTLRELAGAHGKSGGITPQDLVFGIAHQIRNPLAIIKSHAEFCLRRLKLSEKDREPLEAIVRSTQSLGRRLDDLVDLTRSRILQTQPGSVGHLLEQVSVLVRNRCLKQKVELELSVQPGIPDMPLDAEQLKEAFLHVLINALDAMPDGGKLKIEALMMPTGNLARIDFVDTGTGITQEHLKEIFRPFFSTKPSGVGLGLTLSAQIVGLHGGAILADSELGKGTIVKCYLPLTQTKE